LNVVIFTGFLGSGKTSLLLPLARFLVDGTGREVSKTSVVIIENETGEVGIDDGVLRAQGLDVRELFGGCICCQMTADLTSCLNDLAGELEPEWVLVEATGLATPQSIVETIRRYGKGVERIITLAVVDTPRWPELVEVLGPLVSKQVAGADIVLINKTDAVDPEALRAVRETVLSFNEAAPALEVSAAAGIEDRVWREVASR
jgi:G3E family GTPase